MTPHRLQWLCLWLSLTAAAPALGQGLTPDDGEAALARGESLPAWVVPVLRLVSATHVEPTTGIVLSESGLVLVPADFADISDEVIVLDGGTDIIRNGRPARIERTFPDAGIEVLAVDGLRRPAASLAAGPIEDGNGVTLAAFPPAEQIAEGNPPLSAPAVLVVFGETGSPAVSRETPLPNVTGPLVDACGDLAGVSLAAGVQTMDHSPDTRYSWASTLALVYHELQIEPAASRCPQPGPPPEAVPLPEPAPVETPAAEEPALPEPEPETTPETAEAASDEEADAGEPAAPPQEEILDIDVLPPIEKDVTDASAPAKDSASRNGFWLLAAALLFGLGLLLHRLRRSPPGSGPVEAGSEPMVIPPGLDEAQEPDEGPRGTDLDHQLVLKGMLADGSEFEQVCPVSKRAINVTIGRGGADLAIDSPAVSRRHASLNGSWGELTLTDLGSSNGTSINGVPVLENEIMYLEPGDMVILGNVRCQFGIQPRKAAPEVGD